ncbi:mechanosensitive ion channel family protein [Desulfoscipio geothermicus]|uniref:Small conductance mechanosensitive channel n=1 Tax=Desulfoscipio geothermicus DSM 3669 TaxID=1121426 RepID=A0A1I6DTQ4_9FIRM|nr:mechanosensitive ion channel family protein [Desulfoscipio geothermicus]SFR08845.1 small conductance mechanosensitive channel [Desulfoscipio geothermicus DSM 3669]
MKTFENWLAGINIQSLLTDLALAAAVLAVTFIAVKILSFALDRLVKQNKPSPGNEKERQLNDETATGQSILSDSFINSVRALLKTLLLYGGYFMAAVIILEIFNVRIISPDDLKSLGIKLLKTIGILVGAKLAVNFGRLAIKQIFAQREIKDNFIEKRRAQTLEVLLRSVLTYVVFFVTGLMILQIFNVNTSAILASAGILGLAVGFGAQNLVKDVISGFFILFEDQFSVGDFVETAGVVGTVEEVGLRTCKIRQWTGQLHVIPNGEVTRVTNYNRGPMLALVTVGIAYEEDIDRAIAVLQQECEIAFREIETILDTPQVQGVTELADSSVNIRAIAPTVPGEHWAVERELRRRFKYALDRAGIEIPYPRRVLYQRDDEGHKDVGSAHHLPGEGERG